MRRASGIVAQHAGRFTYVLFCSTHRQECGRWPAGSGSPHREVPADPEALPGTCREQAGCRQSSPGLPAHPLIDTPAGTDTSHSLQRGGVR